jgi:hypothetical protein
VPLISAMSIFIAICKKTANLIVNLHKFLMYYNIIMHGLVLIL